MGKIKSCTVLHHLPEINAFERPIEPILQWQGQLSSEQQRASEEIVETVQAEETRLIWAVAGAGKTEMIFEGIAACLRKGGRVCLASPRVDVCLELAPRIKQAFPAVPMALLYGGNEDGYSYTPLVIATTHQLLRFREAFDLLIIDEIDSFPYHDDLGLQFGAQKSRKKSECADLFDCDAFTDDAKRHQARQVGGDSLAGALSRLCIARTGVSVDRRLAQGHQ